MAELKELKPQVQKEIIDMLEYALERAKSGYFQGLALAAVCNDASTFTQFHNGGYIMALIGELRVLERDIIDCCVDTRRKPFYQDES